jgi:hypothetical protein
MSDAERLREERVVKRVKIREVLIRFMSCWLRLLVRGYWLEVIG